MTKPSKFFLLIVSIVIGISSLALAREMEDYPLVKLRSLDKITARTMTFEAKVGSTVRFGNILIKVQTCRKAPPVEEPESAVFLQIWEDNESAEQEWIFSGWMFASSPGLSHMDHPVYDVWVLDCMTQKTAAAEEPEEEVTPDPAASEDTPEPENETPAQEDQNLE